jgi:hypothetical protein
MTTEEAKGKNDKAPQNNPKVSGPAKKVASGSAGPGGGKPPKDSVTPKDTKRGQAKHGSPAGNVPKDKTGPTVSATSTKRGKK